MADRIRVSSEELQTCITAYQRAGQKLMQASQTYSKALNALANDWTGRAFAIMSMKVAQMLKNLSQSFEKCMDAINELTQVKQQFEQNESSLTGGFNSLDTGDSPFK